MADTPQTPRTKTSKPSLDIDVFSEIGSPISPSSPSFSACPSPTFSFSMNMNKSQAELTALLKDAYNALKEKERDLTLAAEIGKSLLESNISLKAKCEALATQLQQLQRDRTRNATFTLQAGAVNKSNVPPIAPPDSFLDEFDFEESDTDSIYGRSSSVDISHSIHEPSKKSKQHVNYNDLENLRELENRNLFLQSQLDDAIKECAENEKLNKAKLRKLESELLHYQDVYSSATLKIEDLEKEKERLIQKQKSEFWNLKYNKSDNDGYVESLLIRLSDLEEQNHNIKRTKEEIERRLARVTRELDALQKQYNELAEASKDNEILRVATMEQDRLITDLHETIEEQKIIIAGMRAGYSRNQSRSNSFSENNIMTNAIRRLSNPDNFSLFGSANSDHQSKSLLSEFESEWFRQLTMFQRDGKKLRGNIDSPLFSPASSERDPNSYFSHPDDDISQIDYLSDGEFSFLDEFEDDEDTIRKREWFWRRWIRRWVEAIYAFLMM
ncbi:13916_t:CDS:2, partial [Acaulospora colombiana]